MSVNSEYKRYFIILQEDDKGYEISPGKIPTGYVKVEIKSGKVKLTAFIQNIKNGDKSEYRFLLIAASKKSAVEIGKIVIDSSGRGELHYEFESDNVLRSNMDISQFTIAAVASANAIPLSGYVGRDKVEWKNTYEIVNRTESKERIDKVKEKVEEIVAPITQKPEKIEKIPEALESVEKIVEKAPEAVKQVEKIIEKAPEAIKQVEKIVEKAPEVVKQVEKIVEKVPEVVEQVDKTVKKPSEIIKPIEQYKDSSEKQMPYMQFIKAEIMPEMELKSEPMIEKKRDIEEEHLEPEIGIRTEKENKEAREFITDKKLDNEFYYYDDEDEEADYERHKKHDKHENKYHNGCGDKCENKHCKEHEECNEDYSNDYYYQSPLYQRLENVFDRLREYDPFDEKEREYKWFKIEDDIYLLNSAAIPFMGAMMPLGYPFMMEECALMIGKKDYIIGVKYDRISKREDKKHARLICYGVPGIYNKREEMYYKMKGYSQFKPHKAHNYGYWIMCVDIRTGQVKL